MLPASPSTALLDEVRFATDYIFHMPCCGGTALDRDKVIYLDESVSPEGLGSHWKPLRLNLIGRKSISPYIASF